MQEIEIFDVREIPDWLAELVIRKFIFFFRKNRKVYISDIVKELHLDIEQVERILNKLGMRRLK